jgi:cytochrome c oxidase assembly factor CtaG
METASLLAVTLIYLRGWLRIRRVTHDGRGRFRLTAFLAGAGVLWAALWSPLGALHHQRLVFHMVEHLLVMTIAAPLLLLSSPLIALRHGLWRAPREALESILSIKAIRALGRAVSHPLTCWLIATSVVLGWHIPFVFVAGMHSPLLHAIQRATFVIAGLLFWWPVIRPWPVPARGPRWSVPLYLFLATLPCDGLSAFLAFCGRPVYAPYGAPGSAHAGHQLGDQAAAGALMWLWVTVAYLIPAVAITIRIISPAGSNWRAGCMNDSRWQPKTMEPTKNGFWSGAGRATGGPSST